MMDDIYFSTNLARIQDLADISLVGRNFYTLVYETFLDPAVPTVRNTLRIDGINYRSRPYLDGRPLTLIEDLHDDEVNLTDGMFRRRHYDVSAGGRFSIVIEPPLHPGNFSMGLSDVHQSSIRGKNLQQQGGDHSLAMDGSTAQFMLGWDWCEALPDRATGFYGAVHLERSGPIAILDPTIQTLDLQCSITPSRDQCSNVSLAVLVHLECIKSARDETENDDLLACMDFDTTKLVVTSDWGESWTIQPGSEDVFQEIHVKHPEEVGLWWPHGVGVKNSAHLHSFSLSIQKNGVETDQKTIHVGIRTVDTYLDKSLQSQVFRINGKRIYLVGGNWISPDQALRYSASSERYCNELELHAYAGLNLIRVWGGGVAETEAFYDCADRLGLLVYQEFWMTGDNNGRWAGEFSWPLDYSTFLKNSHDTIRRLRHHPSLLFYGGCNECLAPKESEWYPNPPFPIDDGIRRILNELDPGRFYISSSMGGKNQADKFGDDSLWMNRTYSLAYADGPYGMLLPSQFFDRNPGLSFVAKNVSIGFQPEIGSVSAPTYEGLLRFMTEVESEGYPSREAHDVGSVWRFHKHLPWHTRVENTTYDHVYSYFEHDHDVNASEWCFASQLASYEQYSSLVEGFVSHAFEWTSTVILWKTQSPWPSLRGFLYDWYLQSTGSLNGVRSVLRDPVTISFDRSSWHFRMINRRVFPLVFLDKHNIVGEYFWIDLKGNEVDSGILSITKPTVIRPMSSESLKIDGKEDQLEWTESCSSVCFLKIQLMLPRLTQARWLWLANPALGDAAVYSGLGSIRTAQTVRASLRLIQCTVGKKGMILHASITLGPDEETVLFYPIFSATFEGHDILPLLDNGDSSPVLLPGAAQLHHLRSPSFRNEGFVNVQLHSWNSPLTQDQIYCTSSNDQRTKR